MNPNATQLQTTLAPIIAFLAGFLAAKNVFGFDSATWITIMTAVVGAATVVWSAITTRNSAIVNQAVTTDKSTMVSAVAALPEVDHITLDKSVPGATGLENQTPENVVAK